MIGTILEVLFHGREEKSKDTYSHHVAPASLKLKTFLPPCLKCSNYGHALAWHGLMHY